MCNRRVNVTQAQTILPRFQLLPSLLLVSHIFHLPVDDKYDCMGWLASILRGVVVGATGLLAFYFGLLGLMIALPPLQTHLFYLHRVSLTWSKDLNTPEQFGFLHNQVSTFYIPTEDGVQLHAWHILPLQVYLQAQDRLLSISPSGNAKASLPEVTLKLLQDDTDSRLVIYFHGTAGCIASGWRPDSYRAISSAAPDKIHVLSFDYRGFGLSSGFPSEEGLLQDAISVIDWVINKVEIPASRILIYAQSLGTAVAISASQHYAARSPPVGFVGQVLTASFSDVATLTATYRIGGIIPVLSPLARIPSLLDYFNSFLTSTWLSKDRIRDFIRLRQDPKRGGRYHITLIHAEDDADITCQHSNVLYWHAVAAAQGANTTIEDFESHKQKSKISFGQGGWAAEHRDEHGLIRQEMLRYGVHDKVMSYPAIGAAVFRAFHAADPDFANNRIQIESR
jgi:abhydrolase domain-containing protein 12